MSIEIQKELKRKLIFNGLICESAGLLLNIRCYKTEMRKKNKYECFRPGLRIRNHIILGCWIRIGIKVEILEL